MLKISAASEVSGSARPVELLAPTTLTNAGHKLAVTFVALVHPISSPIPAILDLPDPAIERFARFSIRQGFGQRHLRSPGSTASN